MIMLCFTISFPIFFRDPRLLVDQHLKHLVSKNLLICLVDTIITSFPKRWGRNKPDPSAVHKSIRLRLKVARKYEIRSAYDLALIIIDQCSRVFFDRTKTADRQPQVMDLFANAIGTVTNKQAIAFEHFWHYTQVASKIYKSKDTVETADIHKVLLDINPEGKLLREIKDILDELHIMIHIKGVQQRVLKEFKKHVVHMTLPSLAMSKEMGTARPAQLTATNDAGEVVGDSRNAKWTIEFAQDLCAGLEDRIADLNNLKESAEHTEKALDSLLGLKQQQAGVVQARESVIQAEETLRQGRSIMLFTVITIIFLPLSFVSGIFGMNAAEFNGGIWNLRRELKYMFPISLAIILTSFILAFSSFTRASISFFVSLIWTYLVTKSRIYGFWADFKIDSASLSERRKRMVREMKERAMSEEQARREKRAEEKERERWRVEREEKEKIKKGRGRYVARQRDDSVV